VNQPLGHVCVELVDDEDPAGAGVGVDRRFDVRHEVRFRPSRADRRLSHASLGDVPIGHQTQRAVADVLKLDALVHSRATRQRGMLAFEGLHAGLFVAANDVRPLRLELWRLQVLGRTELPLPGDSARGAPSYLAKSASSGSCAV